MWSPSTLEFSNIHRTLCWLVDMPIEVFVDLCWHVEPFVDLCWHAANSLCKFDISCFKLLQMQTNCITTPTAGPSTNYPIYRWCCNTSSPGDSQFPRTTRYVLLESAVSVEMYDNCSEYTFWIGATADISVNSFKHFIFDEISQYVELDECGVLHHPTIIDGGSKYSQVILHHLSLRQFTKIVQHLTAMFSGRVGSLQR